LDCNCNCDGDADTLRSVERYVGSLEAVYSLLTGYSSMVAMYASAKRCSTVSQSGKQLRRCTAQRWTVAAGKTEGEGRKGREGIIFH
jgi:hypothetical protein